uniref:Uncharacterized protein n=1 Tax=Arundo donax TaxID=35708 RepID=A0A0A9FJW1_ARUDO
MGGDDPHWSRGEVPPEGTTGWSSRAEAPPARRPCDGVEDRPTLTLGLGSARCPPRLRQIEEGRM